MKMKKTNHDFKAGDSVKVKEGITDPDSDMDISGWQGRILEIDKGDAGQPLFLIEWDSHTLKAMPESYLEQSEIEGLDWKEFYLELDDIEHAQSRDTQKDVDEAADEIFSRVTWYSSGEEGKRIQKIIAGAKGEMEQLEAWEGCLEKNLTFPFEAEVSEYQEHSRVRQGDRVTVRGISDVDDLYGIIISGKWKGERIEFPLCDLEAIDKGANKQIVSDYAVWFANR
jgi:hypothetical protein